MKYLKKLFGGIPMTWPLVIVSAVLSAAYTAAMLLIPATRNTSLRDIGGDIPCWIMFALIIISNCKTPKEAACKTFVFFLISQPLIYIFQVPFSEQGWHLLWYYPGWFMITLMTFPGAGIGWYTRKKGWLAPVILSVMLFLLVDCGASYFLNALRFPPYQILSGIACVLFAVMLIYGIMQERKQRGLAWAVCAVTTAVSVFVMLRTPFCSGIIMLPEGVSYSDCAAVSVSDDSAAKAYLDDERQEVRLAIKKEKDFELTVTGKDGSVLGRYAVSVIKNREFLCFKPDIRLEEPAQ